MAVVDLVVLDVPVSFVGDRLLVGLVHQLGDVGFVLTEYVVIVLSADSLV